jgi:hypothetical protein
MKIKFYCDSGANIQSRREETMDVSKTGYTEEEWRELSDAEKQEAAQDWANNRLEIGYEEIEDCTRKGVIPHSHHQICRNRKHTMKALLSLILLALAVACTQNQRAKEFGGTATVNLPTGTKLVTATWKGEDLWYLYRDAKPGEKPEKLTFKEDSSFGVLEGTVEFIEH